MDAERNIFGGQTTTAVDDGAAPVDIRCTCTFFRFWDFFGGDNEEDDTFTTIPLKDITPVPADEQYGGGSQQRRNGNQQSWSADENDINDTIENEVVPSHGLGAVTIDDSSQNVENIVANENDTAFTNEPENGPKNEIFRLQMHTEDSLHVTLSFSASTFSEGDSSDNVDGRGNEPYERRDFGEHKYQSDRSSDGGSSSLSFDANEFDEEDFEDDYGLILNNNNDSLNNVDPKPMQQNLPTIQENVENESSDVGTNVKNYLICGG